MLVFKSVLVPILSYGHESWVMTKRVLSQAHEVEKRILRRLQSGTLRDRVHIYEICKTMNGQPTAPPNGNGRRKITRETPKSEQKSKSEIKLNKYMQNVCVSCIQEILSFILTTEK